MIQCLNCGAQMRYDIQTAKLKCDYCGFACDVEEHPFHAAQARHDAYEAMEFSCPQCGGTIIATDHDAVGICPYCRESALLEGRLSEERKPEYIIPFSVTKEQCRKAYLKTARRTWCLPLKMLDQKYLDGFQGLYLPYWVYHVTQKGSVFLQGVIVKQAGKSSVSYYLSLTAEADHDFPWICFDAAADFPDEASENINLYSIDAAKPFSAAYLSGFLADTADMDPDVYREDARDAAVFFTMEDLSRTYSKPVEKTYLYDVPDLKERLKTKVEDTGTALFPVWFLTWRHKKRRSYCAVNGSTGTLTTDFPVSWPIFALMTVLMAVPLFFAYQFAVGRYGGQHYAWLEFAGLLILNAILALHTHTVRQCAEGYDMMPDRAKENEDSAVHIRQNIYRLSRLTAHSKNEDALFGKLRIGTPTISMQCAGQKRSNRNLLEGILLMPAMALVVYIYVISMAAFDAYKNQKSWSQSWGEMVETGRVFGITFKVLICIVIAVRIGLLVYEFFGYEGKKTNLKLYLEMILINILQLMPIVIMFLGTDRILYRAIAAALLVLIGLLSCGMQIFHMNRRISRTVTRYHKTRAEAAGAAKPDTGADVSSFL